MILTGKLLIFITGLQTTWNGASMRASLHSETGMLIKRAARGGAQV
jgi:hypothetical protein